MPQETHSSQRGAPLPSDQDQRALWQQAITRFENTRPTKTDVASPSARTPKNLSFRWFTLSTASNERADARTVVCRDFDNQHMRLWFYSDSRAEKLKQIRQNSHVHLLFFDPQELLQVRCTAKAVILPENETETADRWAHVSPRARHDYLGALPPGTPIAHMQNDSSEPDDRRAHFSVIRCDLQTCDILHLQPSGHRRLRGERGTETHWSFSWLMP